MSALQYNTVYQSLKKVSAEWHAGHVQWSYCWNYLKFYNDGTFIYASIQGDNLKQIEKSFNKNSENITNGHFKVDRDMIYLNFDTIEIRASITREKNIITEGKLAWDMYYPMTTEL